MDSLFLMERYWGSDDSEFEIEKKSDDILNNILKKAKKRKITMKKNEISLNNDSDASIIKNSETSVLKKHTKMKSNATKKTRSETEADNTSKSKYNKKEQSNENILVFHSNDEIKGTHSMVDKKNDKLLSSEQNILCNINDVQNIRKTHESISHKGSSDSDDDANKISMTEKESIYTKSPNESNSEGFLFLGNASSNKNENLPIIVPEWIANPTIIEVDLDADKKNVLELDFLDENTKKNLAKNKIEYLFPVQTSVIPWLIQSDCTRLYFQPSDLCVSAPTGSGKTLAFVIPIVQALKKRVVCQVRALIVLPVGDLAVQVFKVFESFCKGTDLQVSLVVGQKSFLQEQKSLIKCSTRGYMSLADIIVATPGKIIDHINRTPGFSLKFLKYLVIDEADRMMEEIQQGWLKKIENAIYENKNSSICSCFSFNNEYNKVSVSSFNACSLETVSEPVQKLLYSATLSCDLEKLRELSLFRPKLFTTLGGVKTNVNHAKNKNVGELSVGKYVVPNHLVEQYVICESSTKPLILNYLLKEQNFKKVLCFTRTVVNAHRLYLVLSNMLDTKVRELSSSLRVIQRKIVLEQFSSGKINVLICSDLMARGMDIENIDCVISYESPFCLKSYIHRIGRTARAGKKGTAITLLDGKEVFKFSNMLKDTGNFSAVQLHIKPENLIPFEEKFKDALSLTSKILREEKQNKFLNNSQKRKNNSFDQAKRNKR